MIMPIKILYQCKHVLSYWVALGNLIPILFTMVEVINTLVHNGKKITLIPLTKSASRPLVGFGVLNDNLIRDLKS
jgi:hypothetical protein